jgi:Meckel syndrome type 1 protein
MAAMKTMAAPAPMPGLGDTAAHPADTPAQELAKIRLLFALQRHDEAMQRLLAFQQAHPDVALPADLRAQLPNHE